MLQSTKRGLGSFVLGALVLTAAACNSEDPVEPPVEENPDDLSGSYTLVSINAVATGGATLIPPLVNGSMTLSQDSVSGTMATGTMTISITVSGQTQELDGTYENNLDGTWSQDSNNVQATGTYTLAADTLTVVVTEPATAVSTTVWSEN